MLTPRENVLETIKKDGKPDCLTNCYTAFRPIGGDIWQGVLPTNDIAALTKKLDGRMALMGGIDSVIDREDVTEEEVRAEVKKALAAYGNLPHFMPSHTYGGPGTIYPQVETIIIDEINRYNKERFGI